MQPLAVRRYAVGDGAAEKNRRRLAITERVAGSVLRVRMLGSAAIDLAWLGEGAIDDASVTLSNSPWDMAAGVILARGRRPSPRPRRRSAHVPFGRHDCGTQGLATVVFQLL